MIYFLYWFVVFVVIVRTILPAVNYSIRTKSIANILGYLLGTLLTDGAIILLLILVYPVLKFIS